jgi:hypothetical protein
MAENNKQSALVMEEQSQWMGRKVKIQIKISCFTSGP